MLLAMHLPLWAGGGPSLPLMQSACGDRSGRLDLQEGIHQLSALVRFDTAAIVMGPQVMVGGQQHELNLLSALRCD